jgi:hypothetical protein
MAIGKSVSDGKDRDNIEMQGLPDAAGFPGEMERHARFAPGEQGIIAIRAVDVNPEILSF